MIGGFYRQHKLLGTNNEPASRMESIRKQEERWRRTVRIWKRVGRAHRCIVMGDLNLNYHHWEDPDPEHMNMIEEVQRNIETEGFKQIVKGFTRFWSSTQQSLLDHIWTNCPLRIVSSWNLKNGGSDHNKIEVIISMKDLKTAGTTRRRRSWKFFNKSRCLQSLSMIDWSEVLKETSPDLASWNLEDKILSVLNQEAPMKNLQTRTKYVKWLSDETKDLMGLRDCLKEAARITDSISDWAEYRKTKNLCTKKQINDKVFRKELFHQIESEKDSGKLFSLTKELLGWSGCSPPSCFLKDGLPVRKQQEIADMQAIFYSEKVKFSQGVPTTGQLGSFKTIKKFI